MAAGPLDTTTSSGGSEAWPWEKAALHLLGVVLGHVPCPASGGGAAPALALGDETAVFQQGCCCLSHSLQKGGLTLATVSLKFVKKELSKGFCLFPTVAGHHAGSHAELPSASVGELSVMDDRVPNPGLPATSGSKKPGGLH